MSNNFANDPIGGYCGCNGIVTCEIIVPKFIARYPGRKPQIVLELLNPRVHPQPTLQVHLACCDPNEQGRFLNRSPIIRSENDTYDFSKGEILYTPIDVKGIAKQAG